MAFSNWLCTPISRRDLHPAVRSIVLAHELGHLFLHRQEAMQSGDFHEFNLFDMQNNQMEKEKNCRFVLNCAFFLLLCCFAPETAHIPPAASQVWKDRLMHRSLVLRQNAPPESGQVRSRSYARPQTYGEPAGFFSSICFFPLSARPRHIA